MKRNILFFILLANTFAGYTQAVITENQYLYCKISIETKPDSICANFIVINKSNESIYLPQEKMNSGVKWLGPGKIQMFLGCDQQKTLNVDFELFELNAKDTVNFIFKFPSDDIKNEKITNIQVDINYLTHSSLKKISRIHFPKIWFNDYFTKMEWFEFIVFCK